jgi:phosphoribosylformylglycinamidine (FGAM) synthase PurS component
LLEIAADSHGTAVAEAKKMCDQLLANPLMEDYRCEVEDG